MPIPVTVLFHFYRALKEMALEERLAVASWLVKRPHLVDQWLSHSVTVMERGYSNIDEPFHPMRQPRGTTYKRATVGSTAELAAWVAGCLEPDGFWRVHGDQRLDFKMVDYELPPTRTASTSQFEDGRPSTAGMKVDLLLARRDGTPVVCEVKIGTATGYDRDPFYGLIQVLTLTAELISPQQRQRLRQHYKTTADLLADGRIDMAVILFKQLKQARATFQEPLYE